MSNIREFPHPRIAIHYHPTRRQFTLQDVHFALDEKLHALELDLHLRHWDHQVVCNHDGPTARSPLLDQVIDLILTRKGDSATVNADGRQFFLVLDPKADAFDLFDGILTVLRRYESQWSTGVRATDPPRGITVVITGEYRDQLRAHFLPHDVDRLCIIEGHDYSGEIVDLSAGRPPFQWVALKSGDERGRVNNLHAGTDAELQGRYNVRLWDCNPQDLPVCLAAGVDQINCERHRVSRLKHIIRDHSPRGQHPALAIQEDRALLTWQDRSSNDLFVAVGTIDPSGLHFVRQIALTRFLAAKPSVFAPACAFTPDGRLLIAYEAVPGHGPLVRLWHRVIQWLPKRMARFLRRPHSLRYISGRFTSLDQFVTFEGEEHALNSNSGEILRGHDPALTVGSDGRVLIVYEGAEPRGLCYFSGTLNSDGELDGRAHALIDGEICSGYSPAAVLDSTGRAVVIYQEPRSRELLGVTGFVVPSGRIVGRRRWLIHGKTRCGDLPAIAADQSGRLIVAYEANRAGAIQVVSGSFGAAGWIEDGAIRLPPGEERFGRHPTVAFDQDGCVILLHQTTSAHKLGYVHGSLRSGRLIGEERSLTIGMDRR